MHRSILHPEAKADIFSAARWYETRRKGLGRQFSSEVRAKIHFIRAFLKGSAIRYGIVRTTLLESFPFLIHYFIDESTKTVVIAAVLHTSRDPNEWEAGRQPED